MINKETELLIDKICRSCMCQNDNMRNLFESKELLEGQTLQIAEMLSACTSIDVASNDGLPNSLCLNCEDKLNVAYEFKIQCQKSDKTLRGIVNPTNSIKEESLDIVVQPDLINIPEIYQDQDDCGSGSDTSDKKKFVCAFCKKVLRTKKGLKIHQRRHTGEKLRSCNLCKAQFTRTHHLIRHMKTHCKSNSSHRCSECGKTFNKHHILLEHKKSHKSNSPDKIESNNASDENTEINEDESEEQFLQIEIKPKKKKDKGTYQCKYCSKIMTTYVGLKIHMRRHTGSDLAQCKFCDKSFTKSNHLKRHLLTHGFIPEIEKPKTSEKKVMECEFCDRKFKYKKSFNHHMQTEHGMSDESDVPLSTYLEKLENKNTSDESINEKVVAEEEAVATKEIVLIENNTNEIDNENEIDKVVPKNLSNHKIHSCHVCGAGFTRGNHLTRHMTLHRALLVHKCDRCDKSFATPEYLAKHIEEDHINKPYACTICNKPFSRGEHLIRHLKVHQNGTNKEEDLKCSICESTFSRSDHLARHIKIHLLQDKRHVCNECGKAFNRLDNLKTHQKKHTGIKDTTKLHLCIYCGKEFNNSSNMIVHMRRHTGERPYKCAQCGKGFPRSHDLKCHERTHSGEKPYQCTLCGKSFNKSNKLLRHTRVHTGERPYVCNICTRAFTQSNDLALHMRRHTGARPYPCGMCPARFIQSGQLKAHRRSTGHWMETQPDLKGGHRVEPVTPLTEPTPIRFKTHGKLKKESDFLDETKSEEILVESVGLVSNEIIHGGSIINNSKIRELQTDDLTGLTPVLCENNEIKFKPTIENFAISAAGICEIDGDIAKSREQCVSSSATFQNDNVVTYSAVTPTSTSYTTTVNYSFPNYG